MRLVNLLETLQKGEDNMLEHMKNEFNKTKTTNGDSQFESTLDSVLDLFAKGGAMRNQSDSDITKLVSKAFSDDKELTLKTLFYLRDARGGQGEKRIFRLALNHLATTDSDSVIKVLGHVAEYGSWKDLVLLLDVKSVKVRTAILDVLTKQLLADVDSEMNGESITLLAKWLPSENASSKDSKMKARLIRSHLKVDAKTYRKVLSKLRAKINLVETAMSDKKFKEIEYSQVPSQAMLKYRNAFNRQNPEGFGQYMEDLKSGKTEIKATTIAPHEIVSKFTGGGGWSGLGSLGETEETTLDQLWKSLPNSIEGSSNALVMADVSGSMFGGSNVSPIDVSVALAIYISERNTGAYHNHFMTFSSNPSLVSVKGTTIGDKVRNAVKEDWQMSTDLEKAFNKILHVALENDVSQDELPSQLIIVSDMQFNECVRYGGTGTSGRYGYGSSANRIDSSVFKNAKASFAQHGYKLPDIVFWNVNASTLPVTKDENGVALVSGFNPSVMKYIMQSKDLNPVQMMLDVVGSERYAQIKL